MNINEFKKELNSLLDEVNKTVTDPIAVTNSGAYVRLQRAKLDLKEALSCLK